MRVRIFAVAFLALTACSSNGERDSDPAPPEEDDPSYAQNLLGGLERSSVERTRHDMRAVQTALSSYATTEGDYPDAGSWSELGSRIAPNYIRSVPATDAWGNEFVYEKTATGFLITAPSLDGKVGTDDDIALNEGGFVKMPAGYRGLL